ncbi:MAG: UDP-glucose/iron transport system ATP-binding protein [Fusobacteriaceae bacterium]|nr:ATP-binding cassette protein [Fusobacteriales bacterium]MDN5304495.1 UDP-glucose/iron transport system ATP-binding protein [Fusobacteriaceae bacterium]
MEKIIKIENLSLILNDKQIFKNFNLEIDKNEKILLNSKSGSGKTTLLNILFGFFYVESNVFIDNNKLNSKNIEKIREKISYIPQNIFLLDMKVIDFIKYIFSLKQYRKRELDILKLKEYLEKFQLDKNILDNFTNKLSGGEKQRLIIVIAILLDKDIWLLDEPTSAIDSETKKIVIENILRLDKTMIIVSHDKEWLEYENIKIISW